MTYNEIPSSWLGMPSKYTNHSYHKLPDDFQKVLLYGSKMNLVIMMLITLHSESVQEKIQTALSVNAKDILFQEIRAGIACRILEHPKRIE